MPSGMDKIEIKVDLEERTSTFLLPSKMDLSNLASMRQEAQSQLANYSLEEQKELILDLKRVESLDSSGLGYLIWLSKTYSHPKVLVRNCNDQVRRLFDITGMSALFSLE